MDCPVNAFGNFDFGFAFIEQSILWSNIFEVGQNR